MKPKVLAIALTEPEMNIAVDMLKYSKDVYAQGAEPLPDMVKLMEGIIVSVEKQLKDQPDLTPKKQEGLINE